MQHFCGQSILSGYQCVGESIVTERLLGEQDRLERDDHRQQERPIKASRRLCKP